MSPRRLAPSLSLRLKAPRLNRQDAETAGRAAETRASTHLSTLGYTLLATRARSKTGEIDLVMATAETLLFVEVKSRPSLTDAAYALQPRQRTRLLATAAALLATNEHWHRPNTRFDVILIAGTELQHIENAIWIE